MVVSADTFRSVMGHFATGVTVVTLNCDGVDHGMTVNSFASVSLDPPLVLFNADEGTNTHDMIPQAESFAVNILTQKQKWLSNRFAGEHHEMDDPFEDVPLFRAATGAPVLEDTLAYIDCTLEESYPGGDHTIYIGHVEDLGLQQSEENPLTFYTGSYGSID